MARKMFSKIKIIMTEICHKQQSQLLVSLPSTKVIYDNKTLLISAAIHYFYFVQLITITHLRSAHCTIQSFQGLRSPPYILPSSTMMMFNAFFSFILRLSICSSQFGQLFNVICKNWTLSLFGMICFISVTSNSSLFLFFLFLNTIFTC